MTKAGMEIVADKVVGIVGIGRVVAAVVTAAVEMQKKDLSAKMTVTVAWTAVARKGSGFVGM